MNVSLGGLIKTYRINRRLSQFDVATAIGWKDTSRLSKIEQERVKPTRAVVEKIMNALDLDEVERGEFLYAGNYVPTEEDVKKVRKIIQPFLNQWPYPVFVTDFTRRIIAFNKNSLNLFGLGSSWVSKIKKDRLNFFDLVFNPELAKGRITREKSDQNWYEWAKEKIGQFKIEHHYQSNERWFQQLLKRFMPFSHFAEVWNEVRSHTVKSLIHRYSRFTILDKINKRETRLSFNTFVLPYFRDRRFEIELYIPADDKTREFYHGAQLLIPSKLISHVALFTDAKTETVRRFLINHLISKMDEDGKGRYFRYVMNRPGKKEELYRILGTAKSRFHIRDWDDVRKGSYENGKFVINKILTEFKKDLEKSNKLNKIDQIDNVSEVSGYTLQQDRESMLFWEENMEKIFSEIFPEEHLHFSFICVYPLSDVKSLQELNRIKKLHDTHWFLSKDNILKVGDEAVSAFRKSHAD